MFLRLTCSSLWVVVAIDQARSFDVLDFELRLSDEP
jgi:hypothetical protein